MASSFKFVKVSGRVLVMYFLSVLMSAENQGFIVLPDGNCCHGSESIPGDLFLRDCNELLLY